MDVYVARQPIFDLKQNVYGYELLFRSDLENVFKAHDGDDASLAVVTNSFLSIGVEQLTAGKRAFINFTGNLIERKIPALLPRESIVIEVLEDVEPSPPVIEALQSLKRRGYMIALDDFSTAKYSEELIRLADIVKVDFLNSPMANRTSVPLREDLSHVKFVAEKIETRDAFAQASSLGYSFFQGFFFSRPEITVGKELPSHKLTSLALLKEIHSQEPDYNRMADIIGHDVSLSYKLLRLVNSAWFGLRVTVSSVKHALMIMGLREIRRWVSLIALTNLSVGKPDELLVTSVVRAKFAELVAIQAGLEDKSSEAFLAGLFSMMDALLDIPMSEAIGRLPLSDDVKNALLGGSSPLAAVFSLATSYDRCDWDEVSRCTRLLDLATDAPPTAYVAAVSWATEFMEHGKSINDLM